MGVRGLVADVPVSCAQCSGVQVPYWGSCLCYLAGFLPMAMVFPEFLTCVSTFSFLFAQFPLEFALVAS